MPEKSVTFSVRYRDIEQWAKERLNRTLTPYQLWMIDQIAADKTTWLLRRRKDYRFAKQLLQQYVLFEGDYVKHFPTVHFRGVTIDGKKFVYCPQGRICSWAEGDFKNKWCHWHKQYFSEIKGAK